MPISIQCPSCSRTIQVADNLAGQRVRCPECDMPIDVGVPQLPNAQPTGLNNRGKDVAHSVPSPADTTAPPSAPVPLPPTYRRVTWWELGGTISIAVALCAFLSMLAAARSASVTEDNLKKMQGPSTIYVDASSLSHITDEYNQEQQRSHEKAKSDMKSFATQRWAAAAGSLWTFLGFGAIGAVLSVTGRWRSWRTVSAQPFERLSWPSRFLIVGSNLVQLAGALVMIGNMIGCLTVSSPPMSQKSPIDEMRRSLAADERVAFGLAATASLIVALYGWGVHHWVRRREGNLAKRWDRGTIIVVCVTLTVIPCVLLLALWIWYTM